MPYLPNPSEPDTAEKKRRTVQRLNELKVRLWSLMRDVQNDGIELVHHNPYGLTAQQVYDELGTDGEKANNFHYALTLLLMEQAAIDGVDVNLMFPPFAMSADQNGNITVSTDPWTPPN